MTFPEMKKLLLLFIPLVFFFGCEEDESENTSYNCIDNDCFSADGGSGQYATLDDCLSVCGDNNGDSGNSGQWEFCWEVNVSSDFEAKYYWSHSSDSNVPGSSDQTFYLTGGNTSASFTPNCYSYIGWSWGQWFYKLQLVNENGENGCANIEVLTYVNGELIQNDNMIFGCFSGVSANGLSCDDYCSTYGNELIISFPY